MANQKAKKNNVSFEEISYKSAENLENDAFFSGDEIQLKLQKAIAKLPEKQRVVFNMKYYEEMKYEQMSEVLQTSVGALKASYHLAVKKIEEFMLNR
jgi:RNA polymerase sigma-70 factor (ECF subfamily)